MLKLLHTSTKVISEEYYTLTIRGVFFNGNQDLVIKYGNILQIWNFFIQTVTFSTQLYKFNYIWFSLGVEKILVTFLKVA